MIASIRVWVKRSLLPLYLIGAALILPWGVSFSLSNIARFFTQDIIPYPLRVGGGENTISHFGDWLYMMTVDQGLPGIFATVQLTMIALVATGFLTLVVFPLISPLLMGRGGRFGSHIILVIMLSA